MSDAATYMDPPAKAAGTLLGAGVGDALGWPYEDRAHRLRRANGRLPLERGFTAWIKRSGGRYLGYEEPIGLGEYSDDTQLLLATARSILRGPFWWEFLTRVELPVWLLYERGGGTASKRAAKEWALGQPPWSTRTANQYFAAGGNGVAMRIAPHCIARLKESSFSALANDVVRNGIATHGHPRALLGALGHAYAIWLVLRSDKTLQYGELVHRLIDELAEWAVEPQISATAPGWLEAADRAGPEPFSRRWQRTSHEIRDALVVARDALGRGALAVDEETLRTLGCFDPKVNGSGVVSAVSSVFLASRYAADPANGIFLAATAEGADTDTLASMVGSVLGGISGTEWLDGLAIEVQDSGYLRGLADALRGVESVAEPEPETVTERTLESFKRKLSGVSMGGELALPDGRQVQVRAIEERRSLVRSATTTVYGLCTQDGQTLYIPKSTKRSLEETAPPKPESSADLVPARDWRPTDASRVGLRLRVRDLGASRQFYAGALGLPVERAAAGFFQLSCGLLFVVEQSRSSQFPPAGKDAVLPGATVVVKVARLDDCLANVQDAGGCVVQAVEYSGEQRHFHCKDPDGNVVEVWEVLGRPRSDGVLSVANRDHPSGPAIER
jgi:ADP-ribosylglycohydrolase/predicted enzyme related to lactoylglutathione lyase